MRHKQLKKFTNYKNLHRVDIVVLILFPFLAAVLSLIFRANFLFSMLMFFCVPAVYLSFRNPIHVKKSMIFTTVLAVPFTFIIDYLAVVDGAWAIQSTFPRLIALGTTPIEQFVWSFSYVYFVVMYYEHMADRGNIQKHNQWFRWLGGGATCFLGVFFMLYLKYPDLLKVEYAYLWLGTLLFVLPALLFLAKFTSLLAKFLKVSAYFFMLSLVYEITALQLNQWWFPGTHFIGWVEIFSLRFPFEELFFWMIFGAIGVLTYYEFFDDDRK
ncbi:MAG: hypothetical protein HZA34_00335 [Candidatus Pacebacteria bacterium]|nr:hypothetical protein [Candidatus Paceibacterota bacterium]